MFCGFLVDGNCGGGAAFAAGACGEILLVSGSFWKNEMSGFCIVLGSWEGLYVLNER